MSTLQQMRQGVGRAWDTVADGWRQLYEHASHALTRFTPGREKNDEDYQLIRHGSRWGFLAAEVAEDEKEIVVKLEAPGMEPDDFDIQVVDDLLIMRGEKRARRESKEGRYHLLECAYGSFERAVTLPEQVDEAKAKASYKKGILRVALPKSEIGRRRRVTVNAL